MKRFSPATGTIDEWNMAFYRLEDYLRAHNLTNSVYQSQIILRLLERAAAQHALDPTRAPTQLALAEAYAIIDLWFQSLLPDIPEQRAPVVGRVALFILNATEKWPSVFLAEEEDIPAEFRHALREITVLGGPDLRVSSMAPRPLDISPKSEPSEDAWDRINRMSLAVLVGTLILILGAVFYLFAL
ncbi:MAG: hypothetical protein AB9869_22070 [Verrucomicrobiia bacterium]